jgi:hypothetical protein
MQKLQHHEKGAVGQMVGTTVLVAKVIWVGFVIITLWFMAAGFVLCARMVG